MDCGCGGSGGDEGPLGELNPDALAPGWAPELGAGCGCGGRSVCGCGGACNRFGGDAGGDVDFPPVSELAAMDLNGDDAPDSDWLARDFLGVSGPAGDYQDPCDQDEEECNQELEDQGKSATHWCDCIRPWNSDDCVCNVYSNDNELDDDADDDEEDGIDGEPVLVDPFDPTPELPGLVAVPGLLPIIGIKPPTPEIPVPGFQWWVYPLLIPVVYPDMDDSPEGRRPARCTASGSIRNCREAETFEASATGVNCQKCCAQANRVVRGLRSLPAGCDWGHFQCNCNG